MRKAILLVFAAFILAAAALAPAAFAQGRSDTGSPGPGDNCTGYMYGTEIAPDNEQACIVYC